MTDQQVAAPASPYKGLAPFEDSSLDALFFFGREREREIVEANLLAYRLTVLYGESGVGKSSLLRAGVAYGLRRQGEAVVVFSAWSGNPVTSLVAEMRETLAAAFPDAVVDEPEEGLASSLAAWTSALGRDLYLILDQLDEYFLYHADDDSFAAELAEVVTRPGLRVNVVLSIRDDMLSRLDRFKALIPNLLSNYLRLDHLDRRSAREAIVGPVDRYNALVPPDDRVSVEPELVEAVLDQTIAGRVEPGEPLDRNRVEAPYLQLVMQRLWEEERSGDSKTLRLETLERLGGAEEIVRAHLDEALESLSPGDRDLAAKLFNHLVTPSGTKIAHGVGDLAQYASVSEGEVAPVLAALVDERIVRPVMAPGQPDGSRYEIFHDVLAEPVVSWRSRHEAGRELERTRRQAHRRNRRLLAVTIVSLVAAAAMVFVTIWAFAQRHEARKQRAEAEAAARTAMVGELTANAALGLSTDPERSLSLAVQAARLEPTAEIEGVLRSAILRSALAVLHVGASPVNDVAFSEAGFGIAGGDDGTAEIFRSKTGQFLRTLKHGAPVKVALLSPDGNLAVTAGGRRIILWDPRSGTPLHELRAPSALTDGALTSDATRLATATADGHVSVWDTASGDQVSSAALESGVKSVEFSRDASLLLVVEADGHAGLYDVATGDLVHAFGAARVYKPQKQIFQSVTQGRVSAAALSPGGHLAVTAGRKGQKATIFVWEVPDRLHKIFVGTGQILDVEFSPGGTEFVTASADGTAIVWNAGKGRISVLGGHTSIVKRASFSPDGTQVVTASTDGTARVWKARIGKPLLVLAGHQGPLTDAQFSPRGQIVATTGEDGTVRLWDARAQPSLTRVGEAGDRVSAIAVGPDAQTVAAGTSRGRASVWKVGRPGSPVSTIRASGAILAATFRPEPLVLASGAHRSEVWNVAKGRVVRTFPNDPKAAAGALAPGAATVATARGDRVSVWGGGKEPVRRLRAPAAVTALALSPDGRRVAAADVNGLVVTWNMKSGRRASTCHAGRKPLTSVAFDSAGARVLASSEDNSVRVCDATTGRAQRPLRWHHGEVSAAAFSDDGRWVATAGPITAGLGAPGSGEPLFRLPGHAAQLTAVAWSPHGYRIVTGDEDGSIRTYDCRVCGGVRVLLPIAERRLQRISTRPAK